MINTKDILSKLENDDNYYGKFGRQFLSNSDIKTLLSGKPEDLYKPTEKTSAMLIGGYFHTVILEPEKVKSFNIIESSTRNTKKYKDCLLYTSPSPRDRQKSRMPSSA